jgi:hypothetical protein
MVAADLCPFGSPKRIIAPTNRLDKVNVQIDDIVRGPDSILSAAVHRHILDADCAIRCQVAPHTARCVLDALPEFEIPDAEDPNFEAYPETFGRSLFQAAGIDSYVSPRWEDAAEAE